MARKLRRTAWWASGLLVGALAGCGTAGLNGFLLELTQPRVLQTDIEQHRETFLRERDPAAFRWLLTHTLENGMTVAEANRLLGEPGERIERDQEFKKESGEILQTDVAYKWGPDRDGQSVVLFFRDGRLVHFHAKQFAHLAGPESL